MAAPRTPAMWAALKPATRNRYTAALRNVGITNPESYYLSGERLNVARGHTVTPERPSRAPYVDISFIATAERAGIAMWIPDWDSLDRKTQGHYARVFINGRFTKWAGRKLTRREKQARGYLPSDNRDLRMPSVAQFRDIIEWDNILHRYRQKSWGDGTTLDVVDQEGVLIKGEEDWVQFRANYQETFGNV